jgi:hypothetical protein
VRSSRALSTEHTTTSQVSLARHTTWPRHSFIQKTSLLGVNIVSPVTSTSFGTQILSSTCRSERSEGTEGKGVGVINLSMSASVHCMVVNGFKGTLFVQLSVLRQVRSLFQSEFSTGCDLVLPLSIYSISLLLKVIQ